MNIKEVEEILGITRANIRYYEKEGLLSVERKENKYRDYRQEDIAALKKIIVLRKIGVNVEEIKALFEGRAGLSTIIENAASRLGEDIKELKGALRVAGKMKAENSDSFDENYYFDYITAQEKQGNKFIDLCKDILDTEIDIFDRTIKFITRWNFKKVRKETGVITAVILLIILLFVRAVVGMHVWGDGFWDILASPFVVFLLVSAIIIPIYLISRKSPKLAKLLCKVVLWIAGILATALVLYMIVGVVKYNTDRIFRK
ncbi:MAG: MerR family transcriptional regulator [Clostridia bacterium]|nr:MerR family transcriptional regulator [Clostridia bacterium]